MVDRSEFERWRREAAAAMRQAEVSAGAALHNWACFSAEQSAQLALKALLHGLGRAPWGHDLPELGDRARATGLAMTPEAEAALRRLSRHYMAARYPDTLPGGAPSDRYEPADAERALADARLVLRLVDEGWDALDA